MKGKGIPAARIHAILAREARERNGRIKKKNTFVAEMAIL